MNQKRYILKLLDRFGMSDCKPRTTPCEQRLEKGNDSEMVDSKRYREIVGSLIYLMTFTRPDISWVVSKLSIKLSCPRAEDFVAAKHVMRYYRVLRNISCVTGNVMASLILSLIVIQTGLLLWRIGIIPQVIVLA